MGIPCAEAGRAANYFSFFRIKRHRTDQVTLSQLTSSDQAHVILAFNFLLISLLLFLLKNSYGIYRFFIFTLLDISSDSNLPSVLLKLYL